MFNARLPRASLSVLIDTFSADVRGCCSDDSLPQHSLPSFAKMCPKEIVIVWKFRNTPRVFLQSSCPLFSLKAVMANSSPLGEARSCLRRRGARL